MLKNLCAAQEKAGRGAAGLVQVEVAADGTLTYRLDRDKLRAVRGREGRDSLRTKLSVADGELIWRCSMQLCFVEEAFRTLKGDLGLRPIFHQLPERIEAHLFIAFLASCLSITLRQQLRTVTGGLIPRVVLEKLATVQMLDVVVPTTDGANFCSCAAPNPVVTCNSSSTTSTCHSRRSRRPASPPRRCHRRCRGDLWGCLREQSTTGPVQTLQSRKSGYFFFLNGAALRVAGSTPSAAISLRRLER